MLSNVYHATSIQFNVSQTMTRKAVQQWSMFGFTVDSILKDQRFQVERDLDCCEFFSGVGSIWKAADARNFRAAKYDKFRNPGVTDLEGSSQSEDICTEAGFITAVLLMMRIVPGGLATLAPKCASWMFLNVVNTCRKKENGYFGDDSNQSVWEGNKMMVGCMLLLELAILRGLFVLLENPKKSYVWHWLPMLETLDKFVYCFADTFRCAFEHSRKTKIWKEFRFASLGPNPHWAETIVKACPCGSKENHIRTSDVHIDKNGKKRCTGKKDVLRESGAYPLALGVAIVNAWCAGQKLEASIEKIRKLDLPVPSDSRKRSSSWLTPSAASGTRSEEPELSWVTPTAASGTRREKSEEPEVLWVIPPASAPAKIRGNRPSSSSWMAPAPAASSSTSRSTRVSSSSWLTPSVSARQQMSAGMGWQQPHSDK